VGSDERSIAEDLQAYVATALAWNGLVIIVIQMTRILTSVILARLLTPHEYGLAGLALLFSSLALLFSDLGFGAALVQKPTITVLDRSTVFWINAISGFLLSVLGVALARPIAAFFKQPDLTPLLMAVSVSFFLISLQNTQYSLLQRAMNYRALSLRLIFATIGGAAVGVTVAVFGGGAWALVAQAVTISFLSAILLWLTSDWRPQFVFSRESVRNTIGFGGRVFGARVLDYSQRNVDNILIGRYLGTTSLGFYSVGYNIILLPLQRLIVPVQDTLFTAFSRIQDDELRMKAIWLRAIRAVGALMIPATVGIILIAPELVQVVLGRKWIPAAPVMQILAPVALFQSFGAIAERTLLALGRATTVFRFSLVGTVVSVAAFSIGLLWGIQGVATSYAFVIIPVQVCLIAVTMSALGISGWTLARAVQGVLEAATVMCIACWVCLTALVHTGASASLVVAVVIAVGVAVYLPIAAWRSPEVVDDIKTLSSSRLGRLRTTP